MLREWLRNHLGMDGHFRRDGGKYHEDSPPDCYRVADYFLVLDGMASKSFIGPNSSETKSTKETERRPSVKTLKMPLGKNILCQNCYTALDQSQIQRGKCPHCNKNITTNKEK